MMCKPSALKIKLALHWQILIGLIALIFFGIYLKEYIAYVDWMGSLFMNALKMIVVPLVLSSLVSGIANIGDPTKLGKIGLKTFSLYLAATLIVGTTRLLLVNLFRTSANGWGD